ncbi:MAG: DMT family transporter [Clostridia bacterium]|nr:DMT family transporter [Clostridia bacterium]
MIGVIWSIIAGMAMSVQGVFNTRLSDKIGLYESNLLVQGGAFLLSILAWLILGKGQFGAFREVNRLYLTGGILGIIITIAVMLSIKGLSPTIAISVILVSQLLVAVLIDTFGLFDTPKVPLKWQQILGTCLMIGGILLLKWKKTS